MKLMVVGANHRQASIALRERLAVCPGAWSEYLGACAKQFRCEVVIVNTCNRMEVYLGKLGEDAVLPSPDEVQRHLAHAHQLELPAIQEVAFQFHDREALRHLLRVAGSLESLVLGDAQIAGQVKEGYERAQSAGTAGPVLHGIFQQTRLVAKRIHKETGLLKGKTSVSSIAIDYLRQVFDHFNDKTVLVIGAGKMGELTLRQLKELKPQLILVVNRNTQKALDLAERCGGKARGWESLDEALIQADIILSTTGAPIPIIDYDRFRSVAPQRGGRPVAIIDLAVPRDFDPRIAEIDEVDILVNVDDFQHIRHEVFAHRAAHIPHAERIVAEELDRFYKDWSRRFTGATIARLTEGWNSIRQEVQEECLQRLNGKLTAADKALIEGAFRLLQNKLMHAPIAALHEEANTGQGRSLLDALRKLFRL